MPNRTDTLESVKFALELLRRIPRNCKVTAKVLHEQITDAGFDRDLRSVQRQLRSLSEQFDIECDDRNKPYGYKWKEKAKGLSLPMLTEQESLLLTLAEQHLRNLLPASLMKSMAGFFNQARANLGPPSSAKRAREWLSKVRVVSTTQPLLPPTIQAGVFEEISSALYSNRWLNVQYKNAQGEEWEDSVMPLGLAQQGERLYLVCRFQGYDNERSLAVHRIIGANVKTFTFSRPSAFDLQRYDNDGRFGFGKGKMIRLSFSIEKESGFHLTESPLSQDQQVVEHTDHYDITATVVETAQLDWWLKGFGDRVSRVRRRTPPIK